MKRGECTLCGHRFAGSSGEYVGVQLAVHLHDKHPEAWDDVAESTRWDLEKVKDMEVPD